ncbi:MAG: hypothetical protein IID03_11355 [Candidatus Dadabacteria bacterium]|nr:hypothetical protein [Candidatus Dadabacteria bacterium]
MGSPSSPRPTAVPTTLLLDIKDGVLASCTSIALDKPGGTSGGAAITCFENIANETNRANARMLTKE